MNYHKKYFFSFVICVSKNEELFKLAFKSLIDQNYKEKYEIVVVANGIKKFNYQIEKLLKKEKLRSNIYLNFLKSPSEDLSDSLNFGIKNSNGFYIVRMDSDDISLNTRLSSLKDICEENNYPDLIGSNAYIINKENMIINQSNLPLNKFKISTTLYFKNPFIHPSVAFKYNSYNKSGKYKSFYGCEDFYLWIQFKKLKMNMFNINDKLLYYRITRNKQRNRSKVHFIMCKILFNEFKNSFNFMYLIGSIYNFLLIIMTSIWLTSLRKK